MLQWVQTYAGDILVMGVLAVLVIGIVMHMIRDRKKGKSGCGCNCSGCSMAGACHSKKT